MFVRNNKDGYITITENTVRDNLPNPNQTNRCDGIEVNLNRNSDYAGDDGFIDNFPGSVKPVTLFANMTIGTLGFGSSMSSKRKLCWFNWFDLNLCLHSI